MHTQSLLLFKNIIFYLAFRKGLNRGFYEFCTCLLRHENSTDSVESWQTGGKGCFSLSLWTAHIHSYKELSSSIRLLNIQCTLFIILLHSWENVRMRFFLIFCVYSCIVYCKVFILAKFWHRRHNGTAYFWMKLLVDWSIGWWRCYIDVFPVVSIISSGCESVCALNEQHLFIWKVRYYY